MKLAHRPLGLSVALLTAGGLIVSPLAAAPQAGGAQEQPSQGGDFDIGLGDESALNVEVVSVEKNKFEKAKTLQSNGDYAGAAMAFDEILKDKKAKDYHEDAELLLARSLYHLHYYHAALGAFVRILQKGEKHKSYQISKEWLFFISRKTEDQGVVVEEIARYAANDLPEKYADEFHFLLAKMYFTKATDEELKQQRDAKAEEEEAPAEEEEAPAAPKKPKEEENLEFDPNELGGGGDDGLDFGLDDLDDKPKKKGKKGKKGKNNKDPDKDTDPPEATKAPPPDDSFQLDMDDKPKTVDAPPKETPKAAKSEDKKPAAPKALVTDTREGLDKCIENAQQVRTESTLYLRATYLKAVCHYEAGNAEKAVEGFREVVRLTNPKGGRFKASTALREEAFFSLARTHYSFQQFRAAIFYYNKISRDSAAWLDALFESSWAYFRLADYEKALGNLVTLHAPFFTAEYFPESLILKAVTYYENCRYPEALAILSEFDGQYGPLMKELDKLTADAKTPEDYYTLLKTLEKTKNASALTQRLVKLARSDRGLTLMASSASELEAEEKRILNAPGALKGSPLATRLLDEVKKRREAVATAAGTIARYKLEAERDELKALSSQLFRIKFEITKREKEGLEASLLNVKQSNTLVGYRFTSAVADDELYWPFDGEYWRDELGTYQYTLSKGCRQ